MNIVMNDGVVQISKPDSWVQQHLFAGIFVLLEDSGKGLKGTLLLLETG